MGNSFFSMPYRVTYILDEILLLSIRTCSIYVHVIILSRLSFRSDVRLGASNGPTLIGGKLLYIVVPHPSPLPSNEVNLWSPTPPHQGALGNYFSSIPRPQHNNECSLPALYITSNCTMGMSFI